MNSSLSSMGKQDPDDVLFHHSNQARIITLNRPSKYNALNGSMIDKITPRLKEFSKSDQSNLIILKSACKPSFCSGGDVIECTNMNLQNKTHESIDYFNKEYNLNYFMSTYNKPIVTLLNGITMGGGAGLSVHTPFRVSCEATKFAMPEANIGFFSDVGTTFYLNKLDYNLGYYLALTGEILEGLDCFIAGIATHYVPLRKFDSLTERLSQIDYNFASTDSDLKAPTTSSKQDTREIYEKINNTIEEFAEPIPKNYKFKYSVDDLKTIESCFNPEFTIHQVIESLSENGSEFALKTLKTLQEKSPVSLFLIMEMLKRSRSTNIYEALRNELILASNMMYKPQYCDFNECITKRLVNRKSSNPDDKIPIFKYKTVADVPVEIIEKELLSPSSHMVQMLDTSELSPSEKLAATNATNGSSSSDTSAESKILQSLAKLKLENHFNFTFNEYPHQYQLPTVEQLKNYVTGNDNSNRSFAVTRDEVLKYFNRKYNGKLGLEHKIDLMLKKNTKGSKFGEEYLEWIE